MLVARTASLLVLLLLFCGCSPDYVEPGVFVEVHGKVLLDGVPVRGAMVVLVPEQIGIGEAFAISSGTTNAMGEFELNTAGGIDGALAGKHRVYISRIDEDQGELPSKPIAGASNDEKIVVPFGVVEEPGLVWELVDRSVQQPRGEEIPFYYNLKSEMTYRVIPGRGIQRPTFELSSIDPMLHKRN